MTEYIEIGRPVMVKTIEFIGQTAGSNGQLIDSMQVNTVAPEKSNIGKYVIAGIALGIALILLAEYRKRQKRFGTH